MNALRTFGLWVLLLLVLAPLHAQAPQPSYEHSLRELRKELIVHIVDNQRDSAIRTMESARESAAPLRVSPFSPSEERLLQIWQMNWQGAEHLVSRFWEFDKTPFYIPLPDHFDPCAPGLDSLEEKLRMALKRDRSAIQDNLENHAGLGESEKAIARYLYFSAVSDREALRKTIDDAYLHELPLPPDWAHTFARHYPRYYRPTDWQFSLQFGGGVPLGWWGDRKGNRWSRGGIVETGFVLERGGLRYEFLGMRIGNYTLQRDMPTHNGEIWPKGAPLQIFDFTVLGLGPAWQPTPSLRTHVVAICGFGALDLADKWRDSVGLAEQSNMTPAFGVVAGGEWTPWVPSKPDKVEYLRFALQPRIGVRWTGSEWSPARISGVEPYGALHLVMRVLTYKEQDRPWSGKTMRIEN